MRCIRLQPQKLAVAGVEKGVDKRISTTASKIGLTLIAAIELRVLR